MIKDNRPQINLRCAPSDIELFQRAAKLNGLKLSGWLRQVALKAARRELAAIKEKEAA